MPALPPVPNVLKVVIEGSTGLYKWANILHTTWGGSAPTAITLAALNANIEGQWVTFMAPECPNTTSLTKITSTDLSSDTGAQAETLVTDAGTRGDDEIPANAAVLINYATDLRFRGGHPRSYLFVGGNADMRDSGSWSTLFVAEAEGHWGSFLSGWIGPTYGGMTVPLLAFVLYHGHGGPYIPGRGTLRVAPIVLTIDPSAGVASQEMASQRRRIGRK